jgi:osmotically-inducible protein OsmY
MKRLTFGLMVLGCWFLLAANVRAAASTVTAPAAQARPHLSDAELESKINAKLAKSKIGKDGFTLKVKGGVVTWEGKTNVIQHKGAATRMARTAGALEVVNHIKISDEARQKAAGNLTGSVPRAQVKTN